MPNARELIGGVKSRRSFLNPLFVYAVIWTVVLALYQLSWSRIYAPLHGGMVAFFVATIILAALIGLVFQSWLNARPSHDSVLVSAKLSWLLTGVTVLGFIADFAHEGHVPLVDAVSKDGFGYGEFKGIPAVHVLLVTFSLFYAAVLGHAWSRGSGRARHWYLAQVLLIAGLHLAELSRQAVLFILLMLALLFLSSRRITLRRLAGTLALTVLALFLFGGIGNMRYGMSFWDNSYITGLTKVSDAYPKWLPGQFLWVYIYVVSPLGNLNDLVTKLAPQDNWAGTFINLVPDFLSKRLFPGFDSTTPLTVNYFNVSTGFATSWKFYGFVGMWLTFAVLVLAVIGVAFLVRGRLEQPTWAILCGLVAFMFFNNAFSYSGLSFAVAYPLVASLLSWARRERQRRATRAEAETAS